MGQDSVDLTVLAEPNLPPTADAGADRTGTEGSAITLTGSGSQPDGNPLTSTLADYAAITTEADLASLVAELEKAGRFALTVIGDCPGGMRASIYNAFPKKGVEALVSFLKEFAAKNG